MEVEAVDKVHPAAFLDRDGVINRDTGYVGTIERFEFLPGVFSACRQFNELGYRICIVTNQGGIGLGRYTEDDYRQLTDHMLLELSRQDVKIAAVYHCPYHPDGDQKYRHWSPWRKPEPGMILKAAEDHRLDPARSLMVGDRISDMQAAAAAGIVRRFLICTGRAPEGVEACSSLAEIPALLQAPSPASSR